MPPITVQHQTEIANTVRGYLSSSNNTATVRTNVRGRATSAPATGFPLKLEQVHNVNTQHGLPDNAVLKYNKTTGMWEPAEYAPPGSQVTAKRFDFNNSLDWLVVHNMNTTAFKKTLMLSDGSEFSAKTQIVDQNSFLVKLTSAQSGWVDVLFGA